MQNSPPRVKGLAVVEKYDRAFRYLYKITRNIPRRHGAFREKMLAAMLEIPDLLYVAAKSNQISRIREADAKLAFLRWCLRHATSDEFKFMTPHQHEIASIMLAEVGSLLGGWMKDKASR